MEAYELYLKGRALLGRRDIPALEEAARRFERALEKDSAFAPAQAGLANAYALMSAPTSSTLPFETAQAIIRRAAPRARELDPLLAEAHMAMGWMFAREHDRANADSAFRRAIELDPGLTEARTSYSTSTLQPLGKLDDALRILRVAGSCTSSPGGTATRSMRFSTSYPSNPNFRLQRAISRARCCSTARSVRRFR